MKATYIFIIVTVLYPTYRLSLRIRWNTAAQYLGGNSIGENSFKRAPSTLSKGPFTRAILNVVIFIPVYAINRWQSMQQKNPLNDSL